MQIRGDFGNPIRRLLRPGLWTAAVIFLILAATVPAQAVAPVRIALDVEAGYRTDDLDWNIAGNTAGTNPNILSELIWSDLEAFQVSGRMRLYWMRFLYLRGLFQGGWIYAGDNRDSDYLGDNRTIEFSRSVNNAGDGSLWDVSGAAGLRYAVPVPGGRVEFIPLVGYSRHQQNLTIMDGFQVIPSTGSFNGLDSTYDARWRGPWLGMDFLLKITDIALEGTFEYHIVRYRGEGNWNLRTDLQHPLSFLHTADGTGVIASLAADYRLIWNLSLHADFTYMDFSTDPGNDRTFFADGTTSDTRLNEVNWNSLALMLGLLFVF